MKRRCKRRPVRTLISAAALRVHQTEPVFIQRQRLHIGAPVIQKQRDLIFRRIPVFILEVVVARDVPSAGIGQRNARLAAVLPIDGISALIGSVCVKDEHIFRHAAPGGHIPRAFQPLHHVVLDFILHQGQIAQGHKAPDDRSAVRERILCRNLRGHIRPIVAQHPHALKGRPLGDAELRELGNKRVIRQEGIARRPNVHIQHPDPCFIERFAPRRIAQQRVFDPADAACAFADVVHHACPRFPVPVCIPAQRKKLALQADGRLSFCRAPRGFAEGRAVNRRGLFADMALPPPRIAIFQTVHPAFEGGAHVIDGQHIVNGSREKPDVEILQPERRCAIEHPAVSVGKPIDVRAAVVLAPLRKNRRAVQLRLDERVTPLLSAEGIAL